MERDFGIEEYVGGNKDPIPCVLKQLYTDFIVQEIIENGHILPLRGLLQEKVDKEPVIVPEVSAPDCLTADVVAGLEEFVSKLGENPTNTFEIEVKDFAKEQRTAVHKFIRQKFPDMLNSELKGEQIVVSSDSGGRNSLKRKRWSPETPDFLHFTLAKENKDTSYALGILAKFIRVKPDLFRTCGIKDKRAVTSQRVSCYRVPKEKIVQIVPRLRDFTLFDFEYKKEGLKMGGHWGNFFSIILRNIPKESREEMTARCEIFKNQGFINYFGTQRFGSSIQNTAETGKLILRRKWEQAVKNIMKVTTQMGKTTVAQAAAHFLETGDAKESLKKLKGGQAFASLESSILKALSHGKTWQQCLTEVLPVNMRSLYVHAYQSLIWNKMVSRRIRDVADSAVGEQLPLPGSDIGSFPEYAKKWLDELLAEDNLTNDSFAGLRDRFALGDCSRAVVIMPGDVNCEFISYSQPRQVLQEGLYDKNLVQLEGDDLLALKVQFSLPNGAYATVALRQVTGFDMGKNNMAEVGKQLLNDGESQDGEEVDAGNEESVEQE